MISLILYSQKDLRTFLTFFQISLENNVNQNKPLTKILTKSNKISIAQSSKKIQVSSAIDLLDALYTTRFWLNFTIFYDSPENRSPRTLVNKCK